MENKKLKEMAVRAASGVVMLLLFAGAVLWSKWSAAALFAVIMIGGLVEFFKLCRAKGYQPMYAFGIFVSIFLFGSLSLSHILWGGSIDVVTLVLLLFLLVAFIPAIFICEIWRKSATPIENIATTLMGIIYVALPMGLLNFIPGLLIGDKGGWNPWVLLAFVSLIWANDVFAYLVGVTCGKHRLCERISPKKSWEGFFGGLVGAMALAVLYGHIFECNLVRWAIVGLIASLAGVAGDLVESMFKREAEVKDSGKIMPGHGGFLDRFDALFIAVPFVVLYLMFSYTFA